ncbi:MAG: hypothetical protein NTW17_03535 [Candidatus Pacearchaeota archaeon]|nr:hypothetical protein [Candidatus Pacearchaeota archaeon]
MNQRRGWSKELAVFSAIFLVILFISMPVVSAQSYSGFHRFTDNVKLFFSGGDNKVRLALEIREKEIDSAMYNAQLGNDEKAIKNLESAISKLKIVQKKVSPDTADEVRNNIEEIESRVRGNSDLNSSAYFEKYLAEEEKTSLSADLSQKVFNYCDELATQDYNLMLEDEKCSSYSWMKDKVEKSVDEKKGEDLVKIKEQMSICTSNPKECNCEDISLASEKANCESYKALAVKCEFQDEDSACKEIDKIGDVQNSERENYEKEVIEKYLPAECSEAGIRDGEECKKLILTLNQPKTECMVEGNYVGEEECKEKLVSDGNAIKECVVDGKLVDPAQCLTNVKEANKPAGNEFELMSGECKERGVYDPIACDEIVNLPRPCKDAGYYTKKECEVMTLKQNLPQECVDAGALTPEACEKLKLPSDCQGAFSREECETIKIEQKFPEECKIAGELDPQKCALIIVGEHSLAVTPGAEMEYLIRQGLTFEEIPGVCTTGTSVKTFIRSDACDAELAKLGIILPPPTATFGIAKECMVDERTTVSPEECRGRLEKRLIIDTIPKECQEANTTNPKECGGLIEEKRVEEGIGINMPGECIGVSTEECKAIMKEKGIEINKIEQVNLPKECISMGVSDAKDCNIIAGKINEERIKQGDEITVDEEGKVDYVTDEQIEQIVDDSEKKSQEITPDTKEAEKIKEEVEVIEGDIMKIEEKGTTEAGDESGGEVNNEISEGNNEVSSGGSSGGDNSGGESSEGESSSGGGENNVVSSGSESSGGGESAAGESSGGGDVVATGAVIGSGNKEFFLVKILKEIFGRS